MSSRPAPAAPDPSRPRRSPPLYEAIEALQRLAELFERRRQQLARDAGLSDAQWRVLEEIGRERFMPSLFARRRAMHAAAVSRTLRQLQEAGLVSAAIADADGRQRRYELTARGRQRLERLRRERVHAIDAIWQGFSEPELARFAAFSRRLADRLERYAGERERRGRAGH
jgi:DNA-binding MarR family transcriptional regulator